MFSFCLGIGAFYYLLDFESLRTLGCQSTSRGILATSYDRGKYENLTPSLQERPKFQKPSKFHFVKEWRKLTVPCIETTSGRGFV